MKNAIFLLLFLGFLSSCEKAVEVEQVDAEATIETRSTERSIEIEPEDIYEMDYRYKMFKYLEGRIDNFDGGINLCAQQCYFEYTDCYWIVDSYYAPYEQCIQWVNECATSDCPEAWCDNYQSYEVCQEYQDVIDANIDQILLEIEKCDSEYSKCLEKCDKGPRDEV